MLGGASQSILFEGTRIHDVEEKMLRSRAPAKTPPVPALVRDLESEDIRKMNPLKQNVMEVRPCIYTLSASEGMGAP